MGTYYSGYNLVALVLKPQQWGHCVQSPTPCFLAAARRVWGCGGPPAGCSQPLVSQHGPTPVCAPQGGCVSGVVAIPALYSWLCLPGHFSCLSQGNMEPTAPVFLLLWDCRWSEHPEFGMFSIWFIMRNQILLHLTRGFD